MNTDDRWGLESWGWTVLSSYSWSVLEFEQEHRIAPAVEVPRMSRRSLRLHTTPGHHGSGAQVASYSLLERHSVSPAVGASREDRPLKSRRSHHHSLSGSQSLLLTPQKSSQSLPLNSSLHSCAASDASLLSSLLDESCIQERTLMDSFWGLDGDGDHHDRTILASGDAVMQTSVVSGITCKDCSFQQSAATHSSSKHPSSSSSAPTAAHQHTVPHNTTVYSRDKVRKHRSGVLLLPEVCVEYSRRAAASVACVLSLLVHTVLLQACTQGKDGLCSVSRACVQACRRAWRSSARAVAPLPSVLCHRVALCAAWCSAICGALRVIGADWRYCSTMNSEGHPKQDGHRDTDASLSKGSSSIWQQLLTLMSLLRDFLVTRRCLSNLCRLLLLLIPLLLLAVLCYCGPATLWAILPAVNITDWRVGSLKDISLEEDHTVPFVPPPFPAESQTSSSPLSVDAERVGRAARVERVERSLAELWARVARGERQQQEKSAQLQALYRPLQEQLETGAHLRQLQTSVAAMMDEKLQPLKDEVERNTNNMKQQQQLYVSQQQSHQSRVAELEALLENLAQKTEDIQRAQETTPAPVSDVVDRVSHEALLLEVQRLEAALGSIRADLQGIMGCQGRCEQLDNIQDMVSAQVKQQLQDLFYGAEAEGGTVPDSLLPWLAARFVNGSDLQASLTALEQSILGNVSQLVKQSKQKGQSVCAETLSESVRLSTSQSGLAEQHVELIVKNALRLYSQDRTGMGDYALESGGGSILSTRCSETFETKTALMSLFGLPLWYFSQSPRVVIQPDVHPGNCWAFKGSHGYLVIRLSMRVVPMAFSLEHIPKSLSPTGHITSAPREYAVYGLEDEHLEEGKLLGRYTYEEDGEALQTHPVTEQNDVAFQIIELRVLSNWGHAEYTCLYRFRVHGRPPVY
ncbi:SUN domain-containing protein 1 isoform X1 [Alosa sapidissima]|uniref:SUN domain-containing protein 1 isoform X1 n=2 Tax=Alosa sapidissima TaxID=34773 RepID=UPI001C08171B|nr:SUN domain-containing protein 1 isoform X1 [Alosa sapidissima]